jgi:hypothetical protein
MFTVKHPLMYNKMNTTDRELEPGFRRSRMTTIRGPRTRSVVTFNPTTISPGEELYINIPKLKPSGCLVPGSVSLLFYFKNSNTKSRFMNNLSKLLAKRLQIKVAEETAYYCSGESLFEVYKDLWLTLGDRKKMIEQGVAGENLRKLFSGDDSGVKVGDACEVADALVQSVYGTKLKKPIDKIIGDHGLYNPFTMNNNPMYILTLPEASEVNVLRPINAWLLLALPTLDLICPRELRARLNISSVLPFECVLAFE